MELTKDLEDIGFEVTYHSTWKEYNVRLDTYEQFESQRDLFLQIIANARDYYDNK